MRWTSALPFGGSAECLQAIRHRLRERRAHGPPARLATVPTVRDQFVSDPVQRVVEEETAPATWAVRVACT